MLVRVLITSHKCWNSVLHFYDFQPQDYCFCHHLLKFVQLHHLLNWMIVKPSTVSMLAPYSILRRHFRLLTESYSLIFLFFCTLKRKSDKFIHRFYIIISWLIFVITIENLSMSLNPHKLNTIKKTQTRFKVLNWK